MVRGWLKDTFIAKSTSITFSIDFLFLEKNTSGFVWTPAPNPELTASVFLPRQEKPRGELPQTLAEPGVLLSYLATSRQSPAVRG